MEYRYTLDLLTEDGHPLRSAVVQPDWKAALDWVHFEGIRAGSLPPETRTGAGTVEPIWDGRHGAPYVSGFRVLVRSREGIAVAREIPKTYLRDVAHDLTADLVETRRLEKGSALRWLVTADLVPGGWEAREDRLDAAEDDLFAIEEVARPLPLHEGSLASFMERSACVGSGEEAERHIPVFFPQAILEEAKELARRSSDVETGGVLVGKLHRDCGSHDGNAHELFVEVTAQIHAPHTLAATTKLTFTAATWAAVRAAITLRGREELMCGWWHSHNDWCRLRNCPLERRRTCTGSHPFFSREDAHLHGACFPSGHQVALLISDSAAMGGLTTTVYGWSRGMVVQREFHVLTTQPNVSQKGARRAESIAS